MSKKKYKYIEIPVTEISLEEVGEIPVEDKGLKEVEANFDFQQILKRLTPKQRRVAQVLVDGFSRKEICKIEKISYDTLRDRIEGIKKKLQ